MNLEVPPWIADFRFSAALYIFSCRFPGLWEVVFYLLTFSEFSGRGFSARYVPGFLLGPGGGYLFA